MRRNRFRPGDDAVSPVVGVVLLVGIAVLLTTSVGVFVLGFGPGEPAPETEIQFHEERSGNVTITMVKPVGIVEEEVSVRVNGDPACYKGSDDWAGTGSIDRAETVTVYGANPSPSGSSCNDTPIRSGSTIRVVWEAPGGGRSEIVGEYEKI